MFERLLEPGSTELPYCPCGDEMNMIELKASASDTLVKVFKCETCNREMRLMVWNCETAATAENTV